MYLYGYSYIWIVWQYLTHWFDQGKKEFVYILRSFQLCTVAWLPVVVVPTHYEDDNISLLARGENSQVKVSVCMTFFTRFSLTFSIQIFRKRKSCLSFSGSSIFRLVTALVIVSMRRIVTGIAHLQWKTIQ